MITDDQIRANRERLAAKKAVAEEPRTLFGYPVVEIDQDDLRRGQLLNDVARHTLSIGDEQMRLGAIAVNVSRELLEDYSVSISSVLFSALYEASLVDLSDLAHEWGLIDDDEAQRRRAEFNQRSIDASRAELREILIARGESVE